MLSLFDLLFPRFCVGCRVEGTWLCSVCLLAIEVDHRLKCPDCDVLTEDGGYCPEHWANHQLSGLIMVGVFHKGTIREAIHTLKYNGVRELAVPLGGLLADRVAEFADLQDAVVVPVPLHHRRYIDRGFNQAELIAQRLPYPLKAEWLIRYRPRPPQASLNHDQRQANVRDIYRIPAHFRQVIAGKTIILVDDVSTTGSTLEEIASLFKAAGARSVWGAIIARG